MSERELRRAAVLSRVAEGEWTVGEAAERMEVSYRQGKRLWKRYEAEGARGLVHRSVGRASRRAKPEEMRGKVLGLVREKYGGEEGKRFGPTLAAEHLRSEDGVAIGVETLRRWMLAAGLWSRARKHREHRQRRERQAHFGELVQMDGSFHAWLEERGPGGCLMNLVDDATGTMLCRLGAEETIWAAVGALGAWMERYGVPRALYTDRKNLYVQEPSAQERMRGEQPLTQFGRLCQRLGIRIIAAQSPQAKGRVERSHGTHQDRLVKKLRRKGVRTHAEANRYLAEEYCAEHNRRYARAAAEKADYHLPSPGAPRRREMLRLETERVLGNDWVVQYQGRLFQVERQSSHYAPAQSRVTVCEWEEGRVEIHYRGQKLKWHVIEERPAAAKGERTGPPPRKAERWHPAADHPWRQYADRKAGVRAGPAGAASLALPCAAP
jgi:transposase